MHIKPKWIHAPDIIGEFDITDFALGFDENGAFHHLNTHWDAMVYFCKTLDLAQHQAKQAIERALTEADPQDAEIQIMLDSDLGSANIADETLTKTTIFIVLCSFKEFALKQLWRALKDSRPLPRRRTFGWIKEAFEQKGFWPDSGNPPDHLSEKAYETVRNNFAHGDWSALKEELPKLDLYEEFGEVIRFLREIAERMRSQGFGV